MLQIRQRRTAGGFAAILAALLLVAGCSGGGEEPPGGSETGAEPTPTAPQAPDLSAPGFLSAECPGDVINIALHSTENAEELAQLTFSTNNIGGAVPEGLPFGRAAQTDQIELPSCDDGLATAFLPDPGMLLVQFEEEWGGTSVPSFGLLATDGSLTALTEEQSVDDFDTPTGYVQPQIDVRGNRVIFKEEAPRPTEESPDDTGSSVWELDLATGAASELPPCTVTCHNQYLQLEAETGHLFYRWESTLTSPTPVASSPDGGLVVSAEGPAAKDTTFWVLDSMPRVAGLQGSNFDLEGEQDLPLWLPQESAAYTGTSGIDEPIAFLVDDETAVFSDNELSVVEVSEDLLSQWADATADLDRALPTDPFPVSHTLVPESPRSNSDPVLSPDRTEVLFISEADNGDRSWYRVPVDGSAEPQEIGPVVGDQVAVAWQ